MEQQETEAQVIEDGVERLNGAEALMARLRDRAEKSAAQFADDLRRAGQAPDEGEQGAPRIAEQ